MAAQLRTSDADSPAEPLAKKKSPVKLVAIIGIAIALLIGGMAAKHLFGHPAKKAADKVEVGVRVALDEFLINLADSSNDKYLKTTIALGLKKGVTEEQFKDSVPQTRDAIVMVLSSKTLADVRTNDGKTKLKKEIVANVNKAIGTNTVEEVDFQTFATQ